MMCRWRMEMESTACRDFKRVFLFVLRVGWSNRVLFSPDAELKGERKEGEQKELSRGSGGRS